MKMKPADGTWTFKLKERSSTSMDYSQKAKTTKPVFVIIGDTSLTTSVEFTSGS